MIFGMLMSIISFMLAGIQISRGSDTGTLIYLGASIIFYALYIINLNVDARNTNIRNYFIKRSEENED